MQIAILHFSLIYITHAFLIFTPCLLQALAGTPSEGELKPGDVITKIGERDARHLSHKDAQKLITNAGNNITFQVER